MRTKTPEQIAMQTSRMLNYISTKHWDGKEYVNYARFMKLCERVISIEERYIKAIYRVNGFSMDDKGIVTSGTNEQINAIWYNAATPRKVYVGY